MKIYRQCSNDSSVDFEDDGDYATLRMGTAAAISREDTVSEENKVLWDFDFVLGL